MEKEDISSTDNPGVEAADGEAEPFGLPDSLWRQPGSRQKRKAADKEAMIKRMRQAELGSRSVVLLEPQVEPVDTSCGSTTLSAQNQSHIHHSNPHNTQEHTHVFDESYARFPP